MPRIHVAYINHDSGPEQFASLNAAEVRAWVAKWCRTYWYRPADARPDDMLYRACFPSEVPIPADDMDCIESYFEQQDRTDGGEWYKIDSVGSDDMPHAVNDIFLTVTSDGLHYKDCVANAKRQADGLRSAVVQEYAAGFWTRLAGNTARANWAKFRDPADEESMPPTVSEILAAACELSAHYARHVAEL